MRTGSSCNVRQKALKKSTSTHFDGYQSQPVLTAHPTNYQISIIFGTQKQAGQTRQTGLGAQCTPYFEIFRVCLNNQILKVLSYL